MIVGIPYGLVINSGFAGAGNYSIQLFSRRVGTYRGFLLQRGTFQEELTLGTEYDPVNEYPLQILAVGSREKQLKKHKTI